MDTTNSKQSTSDQPRQFPPVVSVLGHVDHGKTTLLDAIRKSNIAGKETGGITQRIGASSIEILHEGKKRAITFIDTPGHEAFSNMRSQGVNASDITLLIVAADDGVMPQTKESIKTIQASNSPYIVVITKSDAPGANIEKVKQQVVQEGVLLERLGGEVPYIAVSAKTGERVHELLDLILLSYDLSGIKKDASAEFLGVVIESKVDNKRGNVATCIIKQGTVKIGDKIYIQRKEIGKARALFNTQVKSVKGALPGDAVEIMGINQMLEMGELLYSKAPSILPEVAPVIALAEAAPFTLATFFNEGKKNAVAVILKTETSGEIEAIRESLPSTITIIFEGQGDISLSDIMLAKNFPGSLVLGFNVGITKEAKGLAESERVFYKSYKLIYELLDELDDVLLGIKEDEAPIAQAKILARFPGKERGDILGIKVLKGKFSLAQNITIMRGAIEIGKAKISLIKRGKEEVKEVGKNLECGISIVPVLDFEIGDMILSHNNK